MTESNFVFMEDLTVGQKFTAGSIAVTADEIIEFAKKYDPQPFHLNAEDAAKSMFGGLIASGWHTAAMTMRMIIQSSPNFPGGMVGRTVENLNWLRAVKPGDVLSYEGEITDLRPAESAPGRGIMRVKSRTLNQNGKPVLEMDAVIFIPRKSA
ncbi:MAG: MaoC family dehydratase [bacterium]|nr:MaoC family dehydratase [bacterium]